MIVTDPYRTGAPPPNANFDATAAGSAEVRGARAVQAAGESEKVNNPRLDSGAEAQSIRVEHARAQDRQRAEANAEQRDPPTLSEVIADIPNQQLNVAATAALLEAQATANDAPAVGSTQAPQSLLSVQLLIQRLVRDGDLQPTAVRAQSLDVLS